jgi:hypothetical protein
MTMHTYRVLWPMDLEAETPKQAAMMYLMRVLELGQESISDDDRPILEVRQFVDTDKPDKVFEVDTLEWTVKEVRR